jgi:hypothetical protein
MYRARTLLLAALAAVLLAGCTEGDDAAQWAPTTAPPTTPSTAPSTTNPPPRAEAATCRDKSGDGKPADIKSVALRHNGDQLMVRFELTARPPTTGTVHWAILASSPSGDRALQLGVKFQDEKQTAHYVFDAGSAEQQNLPGVASLVGTTLTTEFPYDAVAELGDTWKWSATTNVQGDDVDDCPDEGDDALNPRTVSFPR